MPRPTNVAVRRRHEPRGPAARPSAPRGEGGDTLKPLPSLPVRLLLLAGFVLLLVMLCALDLQNAKSQQGPPAAFTPRVMALATAMLLIARWVPGGAATEGQSKAAAARYVAGNLALACRAARHAHRALPCLKTPA